MNIDELRKKLSDAVERMEAMLAKADEEKRDLTADDQKE
jgi:hypothetical protein